MVVAQEVNLFPDFLMVLFQPVHLGLDLRALFVREEA